MITSALDSTTAAGTTLPAFKSNVLDKDDFLHLLITQLQHQMGHKDIRTTLRYVHWLPNYQVCDSGTDLIADLEGALTAAYA